MPAYLRCLLLQLTEADKLEDRGRTEGPKGCCRSPTPMKFRSRSQGGGSRLESVGEDDELIVENEEAGCDVSEKHSRGGRKHSLPQQLDTVGTRQESMGKLSPGDELVSIGDTPISSMTYQDVCNLMQTLPASLSLEVKKPLSEETIHLNKDQSASKVDAPLDNRITQENNSKSVSTGPQQNRLDFSVLDAGNTGKFFTVSKTFLNSYSRNFSSLNEEELFNSKGADECMDTGPLKSMYCTVDESDSETDSAADPSPQAMRAVKCHANNQHGEVQITDSDDEQVEICYDSTHDSSTQCHSDKNNVQGRPFSLCHEIPDRVNVKQVHTFAAGREELPFTLQQRSTSKPASPPAKFKPTGAFCPSDKKDIAGGFSRDNVSVSSDGFSSQDCSKEVVTVSCDKEVGPDKAQPTSPRQGEVRHSALMHTDSRLPPRTHSELCRSSSDALLTSNKSCNSHLFSQGSEPRCSPLSNSTLGGKTLTSLTLKDRDQVKVNPSLGSKSSVSHIQNNSCQFPWASGLKTQWESARAAHTSRIKLQDKIQRSSTAPRLKGLSIKSKNKAPEGSVTTKSTKAEVASQKKMSVSPLQSPKLQPKKVSLTYNLKTSKQLEKNSTGLPKPSGQKKDHRPPELERKGVEDHPISNPAASDSAAQQCESLAAETQLTHAAPYSQVTSSDKEQPETVTTQRSFIEVRLSSSSSPSSLASTPTLECRETPETNAVPAVGDASTKALKDLDATRIFHKAAGRSESLHEEQCSRAEAVGSCLLNDQASQLDKQDPCAFTEAAVEAEPCHSSSSSSTIIKQDDDVFKSSATMEGEEQNKSNRPKPEGLKTERRSYSIESSLPLDHNSFSVRQRIKSFENLASFDKPVIRAIEIQSFAVTSKPPVGRRSSGSVTASTAGAHFMDGSRSLRRSLSSCADSSSEAPVTSPHLKKSPSTMALIGFESNPVENIRESHTEEKALGVASVSEQDPVSQTPPVSRNRNPRGHSSLSRSRLRELRALSMPDLDKLCTEDFASEANTVTFKTELEIRPRRSLGATAEKLTNLNRSVTSGSVSDEERDNDKKLLHNSWSISLSELSVSTLDQNKLQDVLTSLMCKTDVGTLMQQAKALTESREHHRAPSVQGTSQGSLSPGNITGLPQSREHHRAPSVQGTSQGSLSPGNITGLPQSREHHRAPSVQGTSQGSLSPGNITGLPQSREHHRAPSVQGTSQGSLSPGNITGLPQSREHHRAPSVQGTSQGSLSPGNITGLPQSREHHRAPSVQGTSQGSLSPGNITGLPQSREHHRAPSVQGTSQGSLSPGNITGLPQSREHHRAPSVQGTSQGSLSPGNITGLPQSREHHRAPSVQGTSQGSLSPGNITGLPQSREHHRAPSVQGTSQGSLSPGNITGLPQSREHHRAPSVQGTSQGSLSPGNITGLPQSREHHRAPSVQGTSQGSLSPGNITGLPQSREHHRAPSVQGTSQGSLSPGNITGLPQSREHHRAPSVQGTSQGSLSPGNITGLPQSREHHRAPSVQGTSQGSLSPGNITGLPQSREHHRAPSVQGTSQGSLSPGNITGLPQSREHHRAPSVQGTSQGSLSPGNITGLPQSREHHRAPSVQGTSQGSLSPGNITGLPQSREHHRAPSVF
ncbi:UNVERIFIED_CONTAM: hypothetical protein FKN15_065216 [Acipenser sinensis]